MSIYIVFLLSLATAVYAVLLVTFWVGLKNLKKQKKSNLTDWPSVSIVLPARNEAEVLERTLSSLFSQDYKGNWEIIVVDDRSTDTTPEILKKISSQSERISYVTITEQNPKSPKKNALAKGIEQSKGEIIVTTDADCVYDPSWLTAIISYMQPEVGVVAGLTLFDLPVKKLPYWQKIQWLDFFVMNFMGAGAIGKGIPASCNGSNLAYRRIVFDEISGFGKQSNIVSGDDVLFAQRVSQLTKWKVVFATDEKTFVRSLPVLTFSELINQRLRWSSKGLTYRKSMLAFMFGIYLYYSLIAAIPIIMFFASWSVPYLSSVILIKFLADYILLNKGAETFNQQDQKRYFIPYFIAITIAAPLIGFGGLLLPYRWKGDWYRTAKLPIGINKTMVQLRKFKEKEPHKIDAI